MLIHCVVHVISANSLGECGVLVATLHPRYSDWMVIPSGWQIRVDGYCKWMATPSVWLLRVDGYSEWMVISNEWIFREDGYSKWMATPSVWLLQEGGYSEWMVISNGWLLRWEWLFRVGGCRTLHAPLWGWGYPALGAICLRVGVTPP
jgi:hypothetical protein